MVDKKYYGLKIWAINILILVSFLGCSSNSRKESAKLNEFVLTGEFDKAIDFVKNSKFYNKEENKLLYFFEIGLLHHKKNEYYNSGLYLKKAIALHEKLFKVLISKKLKTYFMNDYQDQYYGESFEVSLMYFYQSLNFLMLSQQGFNEGYTDGKKSIPQRDLSKEEKRKLLFSSRASIVGWNSFLSQLKDNKLGKSVFKVDLLSKVYGGYIHELIGVRSDLQIALQLYKDGLDVLFKNYNSYSSYNNKYIDFKKNFEDLPKVKKSIVKSKFTESTNLYKQTERYLKYKILLLTKKIRPYHYKKTIKQYDIDKEVQKIVKLEYKKGQNVTVLLQHGIIPKKIPKKVYLGLKKGLKSSNSATNILAQFGEVALTLFAADVLRLVPPPSSYNPAGAYFGLNMANIAVKETSIDFELPILETIGTKKSYQIELTNSEGKVFLKDINLINPLSDIGAEAIAEYSAQRYVRLGARLISKHVAAIVTSFLTYKTLKGKNSDNNFMARSAAVFQYIALTKVIKSSEQADLRQWKSLPNSLSISSFSLPTGSYKCKIIELDGSSKKIKKCDDLNIAKNINYTANIKLSN